MKSGSHQVGLRADARGDQNRGRRGGELVVQAVSRGLVGILVQELPQARRLLVSVSDDAALERAVQHLGRK